MGRCDEAVARSKLRQEHYGIGLYIRHLIGIRNPHQILTFFHESIAEGVDGSFCLLIIHVNIVQEMTRHCAYDADQTGGTVEVGAIPETGHEMSCVEEHVHWMNPGEVQLDEMLDQRRILRDVGPIARIMIVYQPLVVLLYGLAE